MSAAAAVRAAVRAAAVLLGALLLAPRCVFVRCDIGGVDTSPDVDIGIGAGAGLTAGGGSSSTSSTSLPSAPAAVSVRVAGDDALRVTIAPPADDGGADVTHYSLTVSPVRDCSDVLADYLPAANNATSGVYKINPPGDGGAFEVWCDFDSVPGHALTVIQRRRDGSQSFDNTWSAYKHGFGSLSNEFWLGNDHIHRLTSWTAGGLRIDMCTFMVGSAARECRVASYASFSIGDEDDDYTLAVSGFTPGSDTTLADALSIHTGQKFTTKDRDNDHHSENCAVRFSGGWWHNACFRVNMNGIWGDDRYAKGIGWEYWPRSDKVPLQWSLDDVQMAFTRPATAQTGGGTTLRLNASGVVPECAGARPAAFWRECLYELPRRHLYGRHRRWSSVRGVPCGILPAGKRVGLLPAV